MDPAPPREKIPRPWRQGVPMAKRLPVCECGKRHRAGQTPKKCSGAPRTMKAVDITDAATNTTRRYACVTEAADDVGANVNTLRAHILYPGNHPHVIGTGNRRYTAVYVQHAVPDHEAAQRPVPGVGN